MEILRCSREGPTKVLYKGFTAVLTDLVLMTFRSETISPENIIRIKVKNLWREGLRGEHFLDVDDKGLLILKVEEAN